MKFQVFYLKQSLRGVGLKRGTVWIDGKKQTFANITMSKVTMKAAFGPNVPDKLPSFYLEGEYESYEIFDDGESIKIWG